MHVTHVMLGLDAGGAEQLVIQTVKAHEGTDVTPELAILDTRRLTLVSHFERAGGTAHVAPRTAIAAGLWLRRVLRRSDLVHTHAPSVGVAVRLLTLSLPRRDRPAIVHTEHNLWSSHRHVTRFANRLTLKLADEVVAVSEPVAASIQSRRRRRPHVHHHGIDGAGFRDRAAADIADARRELGLDPECPVLLTVANPRPQKAYDILLSAFRRPEVVRHQPVLLAVGDGPDLGRLRATVEKEGLDDRIRFLGARSDVPRLMALADVFVLASYSEGLPVALMEAATVGLPTIATAVGGVPGMIHDGVTGLLVQRGDVADLAAAIDQLLSDPEMRARLGAAARRNSADFDVRTTAIWYAVLYKRLVATEAH